MKHGVSSPNSESFTNPWDTIQEGDDRTVGEVEEAVRLKSPTREDRIDKAEARPTFHLNGDIPQASKIKNGDIRRTPTRSNDDIPQTRKDHSSKIPRTSKSNYELKMEFLFGKDYKPEMKRTKSAVETIV